MNEDAVNELIIGGMIRKLTPTRWLLTYYGARLAETLQKLIYENASPSWENPQVVNGEEKIVLKYRPLTTFQVEPLILANPAYLTI